MKFKIAMISLYLEIHICGDNDNAMLYSMLDCIFYYLLNY